MKFSEIGHLFKNTAKDWSEDKAPRLGAALSYYTVFSLAPLLIIIIAILGFFFGKEASQGLLVGQLNTMIGEKSAAAVQELIKNAHRNHGHGVVATVISIAMLLFGATGVFGQLQDALNTIWEVKPKPGRGIKGFLKDRFLSFSMVLGIAFLLLVSLVISSLLAAFGSYLSAMLPGFGMLVQIGNMVISFAVITVLFAMIFKLLPDVNIDWKDVWIGAALTAVLFTVGKYLIGIYLGRGSTTSVFGAAGSLVVILLWVYYSAQILFFGAEFTQAYARRYGSRVEPADNAVRITGADRAQQGTPNRKQGEDNAPPRIETVPVPAIHVTAFSTGRVPWLYKPAFVGFSAMLLVNALKAITGKRRHRKL
jgi:membrane protein